ncbi:MAG: hypothetical protein QG640_282, partial [Patescibacteria group bacterium]|nr:hypothetical protein [Patescibacteria group bacterium]
MLKTLIKIVILVVILVVIAWVIKVEEQAVVLEAPVKPEQPIKLVSVLPGIVLPGD